METFLFWILWFLISLIILKTFYTRHKAAYVLALRRAVIGIDILALFLFFFPWIPGTEITGWNIAMDKNLLVAIILVLLAGSFFLLLASRPLFLKIGAIFQSTAGVLFIIAMIQVFPGTVTISLRHVAPIIASMLLLINIVIVLVLWQQLQIQEKSHKRV